MPLDLRKIIWKYLGLMLERGEFSLSHREMRGSNDKEEGILKERECCGEGVRR